MALLERSLSWFAVTGSIRKESASVQHHLWWRRFYLVEDSVSISFVKLRLGDCALSVEAVGR